MCCLIGLIGLAGLNYVCHGLFLRSNILELILSELEEVLGVAVEAQGDSSQLSIISIFADIEYFEAVSILDEPDVVGLLGGLAGTINGVDADILSVIRLPGVDHYYHMDIIADGDFPQSCHQCILKLKLFKSISLL